MIQRLALWQLPCRFGYQQSRQHKGPSAQTHMPSQGRCAVGNIEMPSSQDPAFESAGRLPLSLGSPAFGPGERHKGLDKAAGSAQLDETFARMTFHWGAKQLAIATGRTSYYPLAALAVPYNAAMPEAEQSAQHSTAHVA